MHPGKISNDTEEQRQRTMELVTELAPLFHTQIGPLLRERYEQAAQTEGRSRGYTRRLRQQNPEATAAQITEMVCGLLLANIIRSWLASLRAGADRATRTVRVGPDMRPVDKRAARFWRMLIEVASFGLVTVYEMNDTLCALKVAHAPHSPLLDAAHRYLTVYGLTAVPEHLPN